MTELVNCVSCGSLYVKTIRDLCPRCYQQEEDYFRRVSTFLRRRENRQSTIAETSDATGVSEQRILDYISQGRLQLIDLPNFRVPCYFCKEKTKYGKLCKSCEKQMSKDLAEHMEESDNKRKQTYYVRNDHDGRRS
ncbi:LOW QUALITY PROTEIN: flagellar protein [Geomicrobium sp. JCM 19055]|nr:LOW QUALITY PROTEIN: flagellar protein [Geomicrobium sp. JCM 19055]